MFCIFIFSISLSFGIIIHSSLSSEVVWEFNVILGIHVEELHLYQLLLTKSLIKYFEPQKGIVLKFIFYNINLKKV